MQRAGEQQESQHAVHQRFVEIDTHHEPLRLGLNTKSQFSQHQQDERKRQCDGHQSDCHRQFQQPVIHIAEQRRQTNQNRQGMDQRHACGPLSNIKRGMA